MAADERNEISINFWPLKVAIKGKYAIRVIAFPIAIVLIALAWRIAFWF